MHTQAAAEASCPILCLGGGTPHKPAVLVGKHVLHEATACADYLVKQVRRKFLRCAADMHVAAKN